MPDKAAFPRPAGTDSERLVDAERERAYLAWIVDASIALADVAAGRIRNTDAALAAIKRRRADKQEK